MYLARNFRSIVRLLYNFSWNLLTINKKTLKLATASIQQNLLMKSLKCIYIITRHRKKQTQWNQKPFPLTIRTRWACTGCVYKGYHLVEYFNNLYSSHWKSFLTVTKNTLYVCHRPLARLETQAPKTFKI